MQKMLKNAIVIKIRALNISIHTYAVFGNLDHRYRNNYTRVQNYLYMLKFADFSETVNYDLVIFFFNVYVTLLTHK